MAQGAVAAPERRVDLASLARYRRAVDYLAAAQIYLQDNCLLEEPLRPEHVKERLLGHWGTCPGLNLVHAHLNRLVVERDASVLLVTGPGHGAAAALANLYLDRTLLERYPQYTLDREGLFRFVRAFSAPGGLPARVTPSTPGAIHEGDGLGHALATAFGAALDSPGLIVACVVGDGEAETGPTAAAWQGTKFLDPATGGSVLPVLHVNEYKASSPTLYGTMADGELSALFQGLGWEPLFAEGPDLDESLAACIDQAWARIAAVSGSDAMRPRRPLIVLRTPKGLGGPRRVDGHPVEGSYRAHGVPAEDLRTSPKHLQLVEDWLRSYRPEELWDGEGRPAPDLAEVCPRGTRRIGLCPQADGGRRRRALDLPPAEGAAGEYLAEVVRRSNGRRDFRIVSPDELESCGLGRVFEATGRAYTWPVGPDDTRLRPDGRVMEIADADTCLAWLQGYVQTGRHGLFVSGAAHAEEAAPLLARYVRWLSDSDDVPWREPAASLNLLVVADEPGPLLAALPATGAGLVHVHRPAQKELVETLDRCLRSAGRLNLIVTASVRP